MPEEKSIEQQNHVENIGDLMELNQRILETANRLFESYVKLAETMAKFKL
jgi:hypothetical protein